jgi:ABC-type glycerol-3-phosphate transport system substrate-binding protein
MRYLEYTRRQFLKATLVGTAGIALAACSSDTGSNGADSSVSVLYDWTYLGAPGAVGNFWRGIQSGVKGTKGSISSLDEVPYDSLFPTVQTQLTAKSGAGLYTYYPDYTTFALEQQGAIVTVDDLVASDESSHWLLASSKFDGKYYGAPQAIELTLLVINRKLFDQAGVDVDTQFESFSAFIEACEKLKAAGITPIQIGSSDQIGAEAWQQLLTLQVAESPTDLLRGVAGELPLTDVTFSFWRDHLPILRDNYMNSGAPNDTQQIAANKFLSGSAGMSLLYTAQVFAPNIGSEYEVIGFPKSDATFSRPAIASGDDLVIAAYGGSQEAAGKVIDYLHQPAQIQNWWNATSTLPADDRFDSSVLQPNALKTWQFITARKGDVYSLWWPDNFYPPDFVTYFLGVPQAVMNGASSAQALHSAQQIFSSFQTQNPQQVEIVKDSILALTPTVQAAATAG